MDGRRKKSRRQRKIGVGGEGRSRRRLKDINREKQEYDKVDNEKNNKKEKHTEDEGGCRREGG